MTDLKAEAKSCHIQYLTNPLKAPFVKQKKRCFSYSFAKRNLALALEEKQGSLVVAFAKATNFSAIQEIRCLTGMKVIEVLCPEKALVEAIEFCYHQKEKETQKYIANLSSNLSKISAADEDVYDLLEHSSSSSVIQILNMIFLEALQQKASDIHFEPVESGLVVRYRIDGVLQKRHEPPQDLLNQLITRIKVLSKLDIAENRLPQDGRIKLKVGNREVDFRVSTVPVVYGERIVLRILDNTNVVIGMDKLGMGDHLLSSFRSHIKENQGIVLVTGPTGSGKTTTLYSAISELCSDQVNIMTVEDPVEYKLSNMAQIGVNPKIDLTFAKGLRHILRQDPDIVMVGEIRDKETAEIAIQAALTGHLVLSTLHTNDAPSAITRLIDMGIESYLLSSTILAVLGQRLVRKICSHCMQKYKPKSLQEKKLCDEGYLYKGKGCEACYELGYLGREGIYELMPMTTNIKKQLLKSPDSDQLRELALQEGMVSMKEHGLEKVRNKLTTISEILRVTK